MSIWERIDFILSLIENIGGDIKIEFKNTDFSEDPELVAKKYCKPGRKVSFKKLKTKTVFEFSE